MSPGQSGGPGGVSRLLGSVSGLRLHMSLLASQPQMQLVDSLLDVGIVEGVQVGVEEEVESVEDLGQQVEFPLEADGDDVGDAGTEHLQDGTGARHEDEEDADEEESGGQVVLPLFR